MGRHAGERCICNGDLISNDHRGDYGRASFMCLECFNCVVKCLSRAIKKGIHNLNFTFYTSQCVICLQDERFGMMPSHSCLCDRCIYVARLILDIRSDMPADIRSNMPAAAAADELIRKTVDAKYVMNIEHSSIFANHLDKVCDADWDYDAGPANDVSPLEILARVRARKCAHAGSA